MTGARGARGAVPPFLAEPTVEIPLMRGGFATISASDLEKVSGHRWYRSHFGYAVAASGESGKNIWMHRVIMDAPKGADVDHIDLDRLNNTRGNLRICSRSENLWNSSRHRDSTSPFKGVTFLKRENCWLARVMAGGKYHYLGRFKTPEAARDARHAAALRLHGEFARSEGCNAD